MQANPLRLFRGTSEPRPGLRRSGGRIPYGVPKSGIPEWVSHFLIFVKGIRTGAGVNDLPGARQSRDPASAALKD